MTRLRLALLALCLAGCATATITTPEGVEVTSRAFLQASVTTCHPGGAADPTCVTVAADYSVSEEFAAVIGFIGRIFGALAGIGG